MSVERVLALSFLTIIGANLVLGNDIVQGSRLPNDYVIRNVSINRPATERGIKLVIPIVDRSNISSINITDRNASNDQSASIVFGGVGHRLAVVYLKAPPHRSLNFTVVARGVKRTPPPPRPPHKPVPPHQRPPPPSPGERPAPPLAHERPGSPSEIHHRPPPPPPPAQRPPHPPRPASSEEDDMFEFDDQFF